MDTNMINRRDIVKGAVGLWTLSALPRGAHAKGRKKGLPNIIFILADDMGYADLSCYGHGFYRTPGIDRLAQEGLRFTQAYANSAVCSATRTALITGRYQYRLPVGLEEPIPKDGDAGLPEGHPTLPSMLQEAGYRTSLIGKWHLGFPPEYHPLKSGYERFFGIYGGATDYFRHSSQDGQAPFGRLIDQWEEVDRQGYLTNLLGDAAVEEIGSAASSGRPFFMSLHFTAPHYPWEGPEDEAVARTLRSLAHLDGGSVETYQKMLSSMDENVGKVLDEVDRLKIADDTIVIFTSDNGGERFSAVWPLTGMKTELLEGGIRVPLLVRWPGKVAPQGVTKQVAISMDFMPTLLAAAGVGQHPDFPSDGENLLPLILGNAAEKPRKLYWRYKAMEQAAVRDGDWKYLKLNDKEYLFNIAQDERERANHIKGETEIAQRLKRDFEEWNSRMLPYGEKNKSYSIKEHWDIPDRY